jgi:hypothetical protein
VRSGGGTTGIDHGGCERGWRPQDLAELNGFASKLTFELKVIDIEALMER